MDARTEKNSRNNKRGRGKNQGDGRLNRKKMNRHALTTIGGLTTIIIVQKQEAQVNRITTDFMDMTESA